LLAGTWANRESSEGLPYEKRCWIGPVEVIFVDLSLLLVRNWEWYFCRLDEWDSLKHQLTESVENPYPYLPINFVIMNIITKSFLEGKCFPLLVSILSGAGGNATRKASL
jgi:hypothetical protein